jgi:hypothetical protein
MRRFAALLFGSALIIPSASAFSARELVDLCPSVGIARDAKTIAVYPGGSPGRSPKEYNHIAVIIAAAATCREDENGNMLADVTVQYALETGSLYRGAAETGIFAAVTRGNAEVGTRLTGAKTVNPEGLGTQMTVTDTIRGLMIGDDDAAEAPDIGIAVGFVK